MGKIAVVGSANIDLVAHVGEFPRPGQTTLGTNFQTFLGGKGANQAVAAGRFADHGSENTDASRVYFVGQVGHDDFGLQLRTGLSAVADTIYLATDESVATGVALILIDSSAQNVITVVPGANGTLSNGHVHASLSEIQPNVVLASLEISLDAVTIAALAVPKEAVFILNPAPAQPLPSALLERVDIITPNETEAAQLTGVEPVLGTPSLAACSAALRALGPAIAIITLGEAGAWVDTGETQYHVAADRVTAVDTTGAGDCFNGVFAAALAEGFGLAEAVRLAIKGAGIAVTRNGAQASMPARHEILE
jgi:ribokinase